MPRHDPLNLMNALARIGAANVPIWERRTAAACDLVSAFADLADALDCLCAVYRLGYPHRGAAAAGRATKARERVADLLDALGLNGDWSRKE